MNILNFIIKEEHRNWIMSYYYNHKYHQFEGTIESTRFNVKLGIVGNTKDELYTDADRARDFYMKHQELYGDN